MKFFFAALALLILTALIFFGINIKNNHMHDCSSRFVIFDSNRKVESNITLAFFDKYGLMTLSGIYHDNGQSLPIYRQIYFKYELSKGNLTLESVKLKRLNGDLPAPAPGEIPLPDFYLTENKDIHYEISRDSAGTFFSRGKIPLFYCADR